MRKYLFLMSILLILSVVLAVPALAQGPSSYASTVNLTNTTGGTGNVT